MNEYIGEELGLRLQIIHDTLLVKWVAGNLIFLLPPLPHAHTQHLSKLVQVSSEFTSPREAQMSLRTGGVAVAVNARTGT